MRKLSLGLVIVGAWCAGCNGSVRVDLGKTQSGGSAGVAGDATGGAAGDATGGLAGVGGSTGGVGGSAVAGTGGAGVAGAAGQPPVLDCTPVATRECDDRHVKATQLGACDDNGWCWENPLPYGINVNAVSARSSDDVWAVSSSHALHFDGSAWHVVKKLPESGDGVWASPEDLTWVSAGNVVYLWAGSSWSETDLGVPVGQLGGTTSFNVWASSAGHTHHFDGQTWQQLTNPATSTVASQAVIGDDEIWISDDTAIHHYLAGSWTSTPFAGPASIAAVARDDVWFVHGDLSKHFNGTGFEDNPLPSGKNYARAWGSTSGQPWLLSEDGSLFHWDGAQLQAKGSPLSLPVNGFTGTAENDLWAVGALGTLAHFDGSNWSSQARLSEDTLASVTAVHGSAADDVWVVGYNMAAHFDGTAWTSHPSSEPDLLDVWVDSPTSAYASSGKDVQHWDGSAWQSLTPMPPAVTALQSLGDGRLWMVSNATTDMKVYRYRAGELTEYQAPVLAEPWAPVLWANSDCDVYVGQTGLAHFDGESWSKVTLPGAPENPKITGIYSPGPDRVWVLADRKLYRYDGSTSTWQGGGFGPQGDAMWGCGERYFLRTKGSITRSIGAGWLQLTSSPFQSAPQMWGAGSNSIVQVDDDAQILRYSPAEPMN